MLQVAVKSILKEVIGKLLSYQAAVCTNKNNNFSQDLGWCRSFAFPVVV
jgi:hypothetical protein